MINYQDELNRIAENYNAEVRAEIAQEESQGNTFQMVENGCEFPCSICKYGNCNEWEKCESCPFYSRVKVAQWEVENFILGRSK